MRNCDEIKHLRYELGRYHKKIADQEAKIKKLENQLDEELGGGLQLHAIMDAALCQIVLICGQDVYDDDDPVRVIGRNLILPRYSVQDLLKRYEVHTRLYEDKDEIVIGILERKDNGE